MSLKFFHIGVKAGDKIKLTAGDTLRVMVSFDYSGSAMGATLIGAIGESDIIGFRKLLLGSSSMSLPSTPGTIMGSVDIEITDEIKAGTYDLLCYIQEARGIPDAMVLGVIVIGEMEVPPVEEKKISTGVLAMLGGAVVLLLFGLTRRRG